MTNEFIKWHGGECPVQIGALVDVQHRDGSVHLRAVACADYSRAEDWGFDNEGGDIVAYRLSDPVIDEQNDECQGSALIRAEVMA